MPPTRSPYKGTEKKLVLAFDIGTTFSGISYSILDPQHVPEIQTVTRFPAQEKVGGDSKIPTIIYYDRAGAVRAVGAEALLANTEEKAEDEGWMRAAWFVYHPNLHLPETIVIPVKVQNSYAPKIDLKFLQLPPDKSIINLFADFMKYLYNCAKIYIEETHPKGPELWKTVQPTIEYVLTHPNGWEGAQQQHMRRAAVLAGLVPDTPSGHKRIQFVTEGEASFHFCIQNGLTIEPMKNGEGILVVDAGGGTIDISAYGQSSETKFEEIAAAECHLQGSIFVTERARAFLSSFLKNSKFADDVERMATDFDHSAKLTFENTDDPLYIRFGRARDHDPAFGIRGGQVKLLGAQVVNFFQPSIACIVGAIQAIVKNQDEKFKRRIATVFLVGGFSASQYLFQRLKAELNPKGINVCRPDRHVNKAVAEGAVSFYLDHSVDTRIAKFAYGFPCHKKFNATLPAHCKRLSTVYGDLDGSLWVPNGFGVILSKATQVSETQEFRRKYIAREADRDVLKRVMPSIVVYRGLSGDPQWMDVDKDQYTTLCHIEAGANEFSSSLTPHVENGRTFYEIDGEIILSFGLTELTAQIAWKENGIEKRGPAKIVYDSLG